jgi:hypothetical protein
MLTMLAQPVDNRMPCHVGRDTSSLADPAVVEQIIKERPPKKSK